MRARIILLACLLLVALSGLGLLVSCGKQTGKVLAKVGDIEISVQDYSEQYYEISPPHRPRQMHTMEGKRGFLDDIINKEILAAEARRRGFADDPNLVQTVKFLTDQEVLTYLREEAVDRQVSLAPGETREFYEKQGTKHHLQMLMFSDMARAKEALEQVRAGTPFENLAHEAVTARVYPNADTGWHTWGDFEEPLNSVAFGLEAGQISDLIEMPGPVWGMVKAVEILPNPELRDFDEMKTGLAEKLKSIKRRARFSEWMKESSEKYGAVVDEDVVGQVIGGLVWNPDPSGEDARPEFSTEEQDLILGRFGAGRWTVRDFIDRMMLLPRTSRPDRSMKPGELVRMLEMMLTNEALLLEGYERGIDRLPEVERKIGRAEEERIVTMLYSSIIRDVGITDDEVVQHYEDFKESLREPEKYALSRIVLSSEEEAKSVLRELRSGGSFEELAKSSSIDPRTGMRGGKMSPATVDMLPPEVRELVVDLGGGKVGGPVKTDEGWMVIRLDEHMPERQLTLEESKQMVQSQLLQQRQASAFEMWLEQKRGEMGVEIFEDALAEVQLVPDQPGPGEGQEGAET